MVPSPHSLSVMKIAAVLLLTIGTCSNPPPGLNDGGPSEMADYATAHAKTLCASMAKCCTYSLDHFNFAACESSFVTQGWDNTLPNSTAVYDAGHLAFNGAQAISCLEALDDIGCKLQITPAQWATVTTACQRVFQGLIPIDGGGCLSAFECAPGSYCNAGTCSPLVGLGASCTDDDLCINPAAAAPAQWCNFVLPDGGTAATGTCQAAQSNGATCGNVDVTDDYACKSLLCGEDNTCGSAADNPSVYLCDAFKL